MSRKNWLLAVSGAVAMTAVGCAHCDTCDDFPRTASTGYTTGSYTPWSPSTSQVVDTLPPEMLATPITTGAPTLAPVTTQPSPFGASDTVEPLPELPKATKPVEDKPVLPAEPPVSPPAASPGVAVPDLK